MEDGGLTSGLLLAAAAGVDLDVVLEVVDDDDDAASSALERERDLEAKEMEVKAEGLQGPRTGRTGQRKRPGNKRYGE